MLFIEICYVLNFLINIAASRKFQTKKNYFDDQDMRLHANNKTLKLVSNLNDHNVLKHQVMKHANHINNQISKRSISEMMKMKKFVQINRSKQTKSRISDKIKNEKKKFINVLKIRNHMTESSSHHSISFHQID